MPKRIVIGVTAAQSLILMSGLPEKFVEEGWDVHVVASPLEGGVIPSFSSEKVIFHGIPMQRQPSPLNDLTSLRNWIKLLRELKPTVVMSGTPKAGLLGMLSARLTKVPVRVYQVRGLRLETATGVSREIFKLIERLTFMAATNAVAVSDSLRVRLFELMLPGKTSVEVLGWGSSNGVDIGRFEGKNVSAPETCRELPAQVKEEKAVIGFVGRLTPDKGVDLLLSACQHLHARDVNFHLLLIGAYEDEGLQQRIETLAGQDNDQSWLTVLGSKKNIEDYYPLMSVLCLPSRREGFPNVVLEAAAAGIPAVVTNSTGAKDSVEDGVTGFVVEEESSEKLADVLQEVLEKPSLRAQLGDAAHRRVIEHFSRERVQGYLYDYIETLHGQRRKK